jgi:putative ABC transport system permease protein
VIRHLLKLVWRRKRSTSLLMLEIAVSFLVVFGVAVLALRLLHNWRQPLGFAWRDVWSVEVDMNVTSDDSWTLEQTQRMARLLAEARALPGVVAAAGAQVVPYEFGMSNGDVTYERRSTMTVIGEVTDGFAETMRLRLVSGRWFGHQDEGAALPPVVLNRRLARLLFDTDDAVGKVVERGRRRFRVVGIVDDFRQFGELAASDAYLFHRIPELDPEARPARRLLLRLVPGASAALEPQILDRLGRVVPGWSLTVEPLAALRQGRFRFQMAPVIAGAVVSAFLLLMVGLGLLGVLWQNVTRRTRELGLRRAAGASRAAVHRQVLLELLLITTLALVVPLVLVLQLPLLLPVEGGVVAAAVVLSLALVYALSALCGLYPSRIATRLPPAEALRWE